MATKKLALGQDVTYVSTKGYQKAAKVIGTSESTQEGHAIEVPTEGHAHLLIFGYSGVSTRLNVPSEKIALDLAKVEAEANEADVVEEARGYFK